MTSADNVLVTILAMIMILGGALALRAFGRWQRLSLNIRIVVAVLVGGFFGSVVLYMAAMLADLLFNANAMGSVWITALYLPAVVAGGLFGLSTTRPEAVDGIGEHV